MNKTAPIRKLGYKIKTLRKANNLTIKALAKHCHLKYDQLKRIETGEVNLRFETLVRIAIALRVDLRELL